LKPGEPVILMGPTGTPTEIHADTKVIRLTQGGVVETDRGPVVVGDRLTATLTVRSLRQIAGTDIITTSSAVTDRGGGLVCTAEATLVHKAGA